MSSRKPYRTWWLAVLALYVLPYIALMLVGSLWLVEHGYFWGWLAFTVMVAAGGWGITAWLRKRRVAMVNVEARPSDDWPPAGQAAWRRVEEIAERIAAQSPSFDEPAWIGAALQEVLREVARHFHPHARQPELETPLPYALRIIEIVAADLRRALCEHVPASHMLTIGDWRALHGAAARGQRWYKFGYALYRLAHLVINPASAAVRECRDLLTGRFLEASAGDLKQWAIRYAVRRAGYYAIELYGGRLALDGQPFSPAPTAQSQREAEHAQEVQRAIGEEPLRILVIGQVKAGKSSLINALFGEEVAPTDIVPRTQRVQPFVLNRNGIPAAIILDTAGYDEHGARREAFAALEKQIANCDLVLAVGAATSAARAADRRLLDDLRAYFLERPDRRPPPLLGVVTHIDQLRPAAEWRPPYDLEHAPKGKALLIRQAVEAVAGDWGLDAQQVIPVCLAPGRLYNVEELLAPAIVESADEANRVKYLRCFAHHRRTENWRLLWKQAQSAGRLVWRRVAGEPNAAEHAVDESPIGKGN